MKGMYPDENVPFSLPIHRQLPDHQRPTFYARFLSCREEIKLRQMLDALSAKAAAADTPLKGEAIYLDGLPEILLFQITGWVHVCNKQGNPVVYGPEGMAEVVDMLMIDDGWALHQHATDAIKLKREDLGKSESPASSAPASSAPAASPTPPAAAGTATTPPAS